MAKKKAPKKSPEGRGDTSGKKPPMTAGQKSRQRMIDRERALNSKPAPPSTSTGGGGGGGGGTAPRKKSRKELLAEKFASKKGGPGTPGYSRRLHAWRKEFAIPGAGGGGGGRGGGGGGSSGIPGGGMIPGGHPDYNETPIAVTGAPGWWRSMVPKTVNEQTQYLATANALLPFLSAADQRTMATHLFVTDPRNFGHLDPTKIQFMGPPTAVTPEGELSNEARWSFLGKPRAQAALTALDSLRSAMGKQETDLGPGYAFMKSLLGAIGTYGAEGTLAPDSGGMYVPTAMTRTQAKNLLGALDPLLAMTKGDQLSAYGPLAQAIATPFFSEGQLIPMTQTNSGQMFGTRNRRLFF